MTGGLFDDEDPGPAPDDGQIDPDDTLDQILRLVAAEHTPLAALVLALHRHMASGGYPPDLWAYPEDYDDSPATTVGTVHLPPMPGDRDGGRPPVA